MDRGSRLVSFILTLVDDTDLKYTSIEAYVWGVRTWTKLQHEPDPIMGVEHWTDFMSSIKVLTWVAGEPRLRFPVDLVRQILVAVDAEWKAGKAEFRDVQWCFLLLLLLFSFSRSECPLPKNQTGAHVFDKMQHWQVADIKLISLDGIGMVVAIRYKGIKQDARIERSEARGTTSEPSESDGGDWAYIGDIDGSLFSIIAWYKRVVQLWGRSLQRM